MNTVQEKRRRTKNMSRSQYEVYLNFMEEDYHFRSGIINPTLGENYLERKWDTLKNMLNSLGNGPCLSSEEWKKRFNDWKHATRSKYRKIKEHRNKTGGGPVTDLKLNDLEERAINVWGKVTVTGAPEVTIYEGIAAAIEEEEKEETVQEATEELENENEDTVETIIINSEVNLPATPSVSEGTNIKTSKRTRTKPLSMLAENLISISHTQNEVNSALIQTLSNFCNEYLEIKKAKLTFAIVKYKFENPDFHYE